MNDEQIKHMVNRFLGWRLPENFRPDNGISYARPNYHPSVDATPTGTNLFDATQATAMVRHMLDGLPGVDAVGAAEAEVGRYVYRRIEALMDAKPGTPEAAELTYLTTIAEAVEEYGEDACGGTDLASAAKATAPISEGE